jgi:antitoxin (DNA-binding transcriptional repressor) of toxin-antitoxin stability system
MMKVVEQQDATRPLAEYAAEIKGGTVVVTDHGRPVAALVSLENADLETVELSTNPEFMRLIERSRAAIRVEGGVSSADMRKTVQ